MRLAALLSPGHRRLPFRRAVTTVHVEAGSVRVLVARGGRAVHWASAPLEQGVVHEGWIADPAVVARQLAPLLESREAGSRNLSVAISGRQCVTRLLEFPELNTRLLKEAVPREIRRVTAVPHEQTRFAWQVVGRGGGQVRVFAVGAPPDVIAAQLEAISLAGGTPAAFDVKPLALTRAVGRSDALIVDLEPEAIEVIIVRERVPVAIRTGPLRPAVDSVDDRLRRLEEELTRTLSYHEETHPEAPFPRSAPAFLTGSLAGSAAEAHVVEMTSGHPVEPLEPALRCPPDLPLASLMVNIGLALRRR